MVNKNLPELKSKPVTRGVIEDCENYREALLECFEWSAQTPFSDPQQMQDALVHIWNVAEAALKHEKIPVAPRE